jgi:glycosyltransferase involved in cell wall biosynthesis
LGIPLYELTSNKPRLIKYPLLISKTLAIIFRNKLKVLFVQNPSIVLSFFSIFVKKLFGFVVVVDAHNAGIYPLEGKSRSLNFIAKLICRNADLVIVTNQHLARVVEKWGGVPFIMPDPLPDFSSHTIVPVSTERSYLLFICTWASDEPYMEVIQAAKELDFDIDIYITGNFHKKLTRSEIEDIPPTIKLLGFVDENDYLSYFKGATAVIDLTTRDNCLVCGGYEAVALEKPGILSESSVNKEIFSEGFVFTRNDARSINKAIAEVLNQEIQLLAAVKKSKECHKRMNNLQSNKLKTSLSI